LRSSPRGVLLERGPRREDRRRFYMYQPLNPNDLWAALREVGAVYFMFRA
jgi:hypothetical protein